MWAGLLIELSGSGPLVSALQPVVCGGLGESAALLEEILLLLPVREEEEEGRRGG